MATAAAVHTSRSRERANRPNEFGMHPAIAAKLAALGIDPEERAQEIRLARGTGRVPPAVGPRLVAARGAPLPGRGRAFAINPNDVRDVNVILDQAAYVYANGTFYADSLAPVQLVTERSAVYQIWGQDDDLSPIDERIGPQGAAKEVEPTLSIDTFKTTPRALMGFTPLDTVLARPRLGLQARTVANIRARQMMGRERRVSTLFNDTTQYPTANVRALGATAKWNGGSAAAPVADILYGLEQIQADVTDILFTDLVWHAAQQNAQLAGIVATQFQNKGLLRPIDFASYFGIPNVWITKTKYKSSSGRVNAWNDGNVWMGVANASPDELSFARTFRLRQGANGFVTQSWHEPNRGENGGDWTRVAYAEDVKIQAPAYGVLITGAKQ